MIHIAVYSCQKLRGLIAVMQFDRYFLMDSQKLLSWRDPNYTAKFNHYILEEGINPITLEPATAEEVQTAEWYNRIHPITETLSWGGCLVFSLCGL